MKHINKDYITTLDNITTKDFILIINHQAKVKKCSPLLAFQMFMEYISEIPPQELMTTPLNVCSTESLKQYKKSKKVGIRK